MKCTAITFLVGYAAVSTLVLIVLGSLLSHCKSAATTEVIKGDKNSVDKQEFGFVVIDNAEEGQQCECEPGILEVGWSILEILVAAALAMAGIVILMKGISAAVESFSKRRQKQSTKKQRKDEDLREKIRLEERQKLSTKESKEEPIAVGYEKGETA